MSTPYSILVLEYHVEYRLRPDSRRPRASAATWSIRSCGYSDPKVASGDAATPAVYLIRFDRDSARGPLLLGQPSEREALFWGGAAAHEEALAGNGPAELPVQDHVGSEVIEIAINRVDSRNGHGPLGRLGKAITDRTMEDQIALLLADFTQPKPARISGSCWPRLAARMATVTSSGRARCLS